MPRPLILIVEDGDNQREFLKTALQRLNDYRLETAQFAAEAFQAAGRFNSDLVIFDLASQDAAESLEAGEGIRKLGIPVIFINGPRGSEPIFPSGDTPSIYFPRPVSTAALASSVELSLHNRSLQKQVREQSAAYKASLEMLPGALGLFDRHSQQLLQANQAFTNLFQLHDERPGQVLLPDLLEFMTGTLDQALENTRKYGNWIGRCLILGIEREGVSCQVRIRPVTTDDPDCPWMVYCMAGRADKIAVEEKTIEVIERHRQEAETLREVTASLTQSLEPNEVVHRILQQMKNVLPYDGFSVMLWEENKLILYASYGIPETVNALLDVSTLPNVQQVIEQKQALVISDTANDDRWIIYPGFEYIHCWMGVPLIHDDRVVGLLNLDKKELGFYTEEDTRLAMAFANQAAIALENARLHERTQRGLKRLSALRIIDNAISSSLDLRFTLEVLLNQVLSNLEVDAADVLLFNERNQTLNYSAGRGFHTGALRHTHIHLGEGYAGQAALQRRTISINELDVSDPAFPHGLLTAVEGFCVYYAAPLIAKGQLKGVLEVFNRAPLNPDQDWLDFLNALALQAGIAVDNVRLFEDLQHKNLELTLSYDITLEVWAQALELRAIEPEGHNRRVAELLERVARYMGFPEEEIGHIRRGAILHNIGKIGISDSILLKEGLLTEDECKIKHLHTVYAYEWLSPISFLKPALDIPYCHHEHWDGSGYPRGLKEEEIPLSARVFVIVDAWDRLTNDRPGQPALPVEEVIEHLRSQAGRQYDPRLVEGFLTFMA